MFPTILAERRIHNKKIDNDSLLWVRKTLPICRFFPFFSSSAECVRSQGGGGEKRWLMIFLPEQVPDQLLAFVPRPALVRTSPTFFFFLRFSLWYEHFRWQKHRQSHFYDFFFRPKCFFFNSMKGGSGIKYLSERLRISFSVIFSVSLCCRLQFIGVSLAQQRGAETSPIGRYHSFESYRLKKKGNLYVHKRFFPLAALSVSEFMFVAFNGGENDFYWDKKKEEEEKKVSTMMQTCCERNIFLLGGRRALNRKIWN